MREKVAFVLTSSSTSKAGEGTGSVMVTTMAPSLSAAPPCASLPISSSPKQVLLAKTTSPARNRDGGGGGGIFFAKNEKTGKIL